MSKHASSTSASALSAKASRNRSRANSLNLIPSTTAASLSTNGPVPSDVSSSIQKSTSKSGRKRRKAKSILRRWKSISLRHTWLNPLIVALTVVACYLANPSDTNPFKHAIFLSHQLPNGRYELGYHDFFFVAFYTVCLTFTRDTIKIPFFDALRTDHVAQFIMQRILRPIAIHYGFFRGKQARFMEQAYTAVYFGILGPLGLYVMKQTPVWYYNTNGMYEGFPHKSHIWEVKTYYLFQAAYWVQQMIVLLLAQEKPRKDFKELVAHHIITISLIYLSYAFHFVYIGLAVYTTHDISDFFLATSKILNYLDSPIVIPYFIVFLFSWAYLRHFINLKILFSLLPLPMPFPDHINEKIFETVAKFNAQSSQFSGNMVAPLLAPVAKFLTTLFPETMNLITSIPGKTMQFFNTPSDFASVGPYELNWETQQYKCWISQYITFGLLLALQLVNMFWFFLILRILWRLLATWGEEVEDVRSEDDDEEEVAERETTLDEMRKEQGDAWAGQTGADIRAGEKPQVLLNGVPEEKANGRAK